MALTREHKMLEVILSAPCTPSLLHSTANLQVNNSTKKAAIG